MKTNYKAGPPHNARADAVRSAARGRWVSTIYPKLGITVGTGKHMPCLACGGTDRFRCDDQRGSGSYFCNKCGPGDGFSLVAKLWQTDFSEAVKLVSTALGFEEKEKGQSARIVATYDYVDATGGLLYQTVRYEPKDFRQRRPDGNGGWVWSIKETQRVLYRLPNLLHTPDEPVIFHEGEKAVDTAVQAGLPGVHTCTVGGAGNPHLTNFGPVQGRDVVVCPDNDEPGEEYLIKVSKLAKAAGARSIKVIRLPNLQLKGDVVEWRQAGGTAEAFAGLIEHAQSIGAEEAENGHDPSKQSGEATTEWTRKAETAQGGRSPERKSQATRLIELAQKAKLWHTTEGETLGTVLVGDHREHHRLRQKGFKQWLAKQYYEDSQGAPSTKALTDALNVLEAKAVFEGKEQAVFIRVAGHDGRIYLDLANEQWQAVEISADGWKVINDPPVAFRRSRGMLPLPTPQGGGSVDLLKPYVNLDWTREGDWHLLVACVLSMLRPKGPYPIQVFNGEQGSAKSTTGKIIRSLVDPNKSPLRSAPRDERDLMIAATNGWALLHDNLSHIDQWLSDAFCRLATGGGFSTRELYSDADEIIFDAQRPVMFNGIEELPSRGDLIDRACMFYLPTIQEKDRKTEADFWSRFEQDRPFILGALLTALSSAMREYPVTKLARLPRMADFAVWSTAAEKGLEWKPGAFMLHYEKNYDEANTLALEASPITEPLNKLLDPLGDSNRLRKNPG